MQLKTLIYHCKRPYHFVKTGLFNGLPAQLRYRFPEKKLSILVITGTDGKTTTTTLLHHLLTAAGKKAALVSTVAAKLGDQEVDTGLHVTSPQPSELYGFIQACVEAEMEYLVLELTSHGSYQYRDWGIRPLLTGLTNIAHEHLDYHPSFELYRQVKIDILNKAQSAVFLNEHDPSYRIVRRKINSGLQIHTYSTPTALNRVVNRAIKARFPEQYNQCNATLAVEMAHALEIPYTTLAEGIATFPGVKGRVQVLENNLDLSVVIDFAHTPQSIDASLAAARKKTTGTLWAVFGTAGLRDTTKRPLMGQAATKHADRVVLTTDDSRNENVWSIINQLKSDLGTEYGKVISIADRLEAIRFALSHAVPGDAIYILGKGHEQSLAVGTEEIPWSDVEETAKLLRAIEEADA